MGRIGNTLTNVVIDGNKVSANYDKVTKNFFGADITDSDVDNVIYIKVGGEYFKNTNEVFSLGMWGGRSDDPTFDNAPAFAACNASMRILKYKMPVLLPSGTYKVVSNGVVFDGGPQGNAPYYIGAGGRSTIIDASGVVGDVAVRFGNDGTTSDTWGDTLHGGLKGVKIVARPDVDALVLASYAPTSNASNTIEDIFIDTCRDGIRSFMNPSNPSSNYRNSFKNIHITNYYRTGLHEGGVYSTYQDIFIVAASGNEAGMGAANLALKVEGSDNTFIGVQTEDQITVTGRDNVFINMSMEYLVKQVPSTEIGGVVLRVAGVNNAFFKFKMVGVDKRVINSLGTIYSTSTTMMNFSYYAGKTLPDGVTVDPNYIPDYPFLPAVGSSGTMINIEVETGFHMDNATFAPGLENWRTLNVFGIGDKFDLILPNFLNKDTGGNVAGYSNFDNLQIMVSLTHQAGALIFDKGAAYKIVNAANDDWINFITEPALGVRDLGAIGGITFAPTALPPDFADDAAAAAGGVPLNRIYRTGNVLKLRLV